MRKGRPARPVELTDDEREALQRFVRRRKTTQQLALRSRIVWRCADGLTNTAVAEELRVSRQTVGKWRSRFSRQGLDGLLDAPRPGAPRTVSDERVERVVTMTLESTPKGAAQWSTREMAKRAGLSHTCL